jgi:hypothetical protein
MDSKLAWHLIGVSFRVAGELQELLPRLKEQCSAEEYKGHARAIAGAIHGVNTALIDRALAAHPELEDRIEAELAEFGRTR